MLNDKSVQGINSSINVFSIISYLGIVVSVCVFYPGVMSPDSIDQLFQATNWSFSSTQPPLMSFIVAILNYFIAGPFLMMLLQICIWWLVWKKILYMLFPESSKSCIAALLVVAFCPPLFAMIGTIWRDVHLSFAMLSCTFFNIRYTKNKNNWMLLFAVLSAAYASSVRINAIFCVVPFALWSGILIISEMKEKSWKIIKYVLVICTILFVMFSGKFLNSIISEKPWQVEQVLLVFDLAGISYHTNQNLIPVSIRNYIDTPEKLARCYSAFSIFPLYYEANDRIILRDRILTTEDPKTVQIILDVWKKAVLDHPKAYLIHRLAVFAAGIGWSDRPVHYAYECGIPKNNLNIVWNQSNFSKKIYQMISFSLDNWTLIWRPWLYLWGTILVTLACVIFWKNGIGILPSAVVTTSSWLYFLPYFFVAPAADLRYYHWPISAFFLSVFFLIHQYYQAEQPVRAKILRSSLWRNAVIFGLISASIGLIWISHNCDVDFGVSVSSSSRGISFNNQGLECLANGKYDQALVYFKMAVKSDPGWWVPKTNMGLVLEKLGEISSAEDFFKKAILLDQSGMASFYRGRFLFSQKRFDDALADFTQSVLSGNDDYQINYMASVSAVKLGKLSESIKFSEACIRLDQTRFSSDIVEISSPFFEKAEFCETGIKYFTEIVKLVPKAWWAHYNLGTLLSRAGRSELAKQSFVEYKKLQPGK
ncbi:MAG: hypothetical protein HQM10_01395 [Candidatus Riflebacteria bacterium]|nr:hypothetical protein [Candidatus Riflebacteria bacterium]